jgi:hypothetical protein
MPDIQLCTAVDGDGNVCRVAHECYRHTATPSTMQAYGPPMEDFDPRDGCDGYIPVKLEPKGKP